jgi:hypothetical protein
VPTWLRDGVWQSDASAELRRLHDLNGELLEALAAASVALSTGHNALIALDKARAAIAKAEPK